jgi:hypothetical protein
MEMCHLGLKNEEKPQDIAFCEIPFLKLWKSAASNKEKQLDIVKNCEKQQSG